MRNVVGIVTALLGQLALVSLPGLLFFLAFWAAVDLGLGIAVGGFYLAIMLGWWLLWGLLNLVRAARSKKSVVAGYVVDWANGLSFVVLVLTVPFVIIEGGKAVYRESPTWFCVTVASLVFVGVSIYDTISFKFGRSTGRFSIRGEQVSEGEGFEND